MDGTHDRPAADTRHITDQTASMGRGSKQQAAQRNTAAPTAAAAAGDDAAPALELQEPVWRLLLGELWQPPEQQVVCRLLCCSRAMARLVHAACAGRLHVCISRQPPHYGAEWEQQVTAYGEAYCCWLAKHARLLVQLRLEGVWDSQLEYVAAGLRAAAGVAAHQRVTRAQAASQSAATRAAAAAAAAGPAPAPAQQQGLPLRSLVSTGYGDCSGLLDGLAACPQPIQLHLELWASELQGLAAALTALRGLQDLSLAVLDTAAVPALQLGTQLTRLRLVGVQLSAAAMRSLPPSLLELKYSPSPGYSVQRPPIDITHLSGLVRLSWQEQQPGDKLPLSLERVELEGPLSLEPLHPLTRLQSLRCVYGPCVYGPYSLEQLQAAVAAIGPSLTALELDVGEELGGKLLSQRIAGPPVLPLTGLSVHDWYAGSVAHLGQWTGLQRLVLSGTCDSPQLAGQLAQLTALQELTFCQRGLQAVQLQPLVDCIVGMASLRSVDGRNDFTVMTSPPGSAGSCRPPQADGAAVWV